MIRSLPTWRQLHPDDDPRVEKRMMVWYRDAEIAEKLRRAEALRQQAMAIALSGLRLRHPHASEHELRRRLADLLFGLDLAQRAYGPGPDEPNPAAGDPRE